VQKNYMIYNYCTDAKRFPQGLPPECSLAWKQKLYIVIYHGKKKKKTSIYNINTLSSYFIVCFTMHIISCKIVCKWLMEKGIIKKGLSTYLVFFFLILWKNQRSNEKYWKKLNACQYLECNLIKK
jgi:hypothetical protein